MMTLINCNNLLKNRIIICFTIVGVLISSQAVSADEGMTSSNTVLSLADCIKIIAVNSDELAYAEFEIEIKKQAHLSAKKDLYPTLNSSYSYLKKKPSNLVNENTYSYSLSVEQPIYKGRSLITAVEIGELNKEVAKSAYNQAHNNLLLSIHNAYYDLLKSQKIEKEADLSVVRLQSHLKDAKAFFKVGLIPKNDLLFSEVELAEGIQLQLIAQNARSLAGSVLNLLLDRPVDKSIQIEDIIETNFRKLQWDELLKNALSIRPELIKSKIENQSIEKNIQLAKVDYLPSVTLTATYKKTGDDPLADYYPLGPSESQSALAVASWRFYSWGQKDNKVIAARKELLKSKKSINLLIDSITLETRKAYLNATHTEKNIDVAKKAVAQAEENFRINEARYKSQLSTSTDVLDAQTILSRANTNYYSTLYNYKKALATLDWATGTLSDSAL